MIDIKTIVLYGFDGCCLDSNNNILKENLRWDDNKAWIKLEIDNETGYIKNWKSMKYIEGSNVS